MKCATRFVLTMTSRQIPAAAGLIQCLWRCYAADKSFQSKVLKKSKILILFPGNVEVAPEGSIWPECCNQQLEGQDYFHPTLHNFYTLHQNLLQDESLCQAVAKKASVLRRRRSKGSIFSINVRIIIQYLHN